MNSFKASMGRSKPKIVEEPEEPEVTELDGQTLTGLDNGAIPTNTASEKKEKKCIELWHPGFDARFPHQNQTRRCWQNYIDFFRCQNRFGEDDKRCEYYRKAYIHLCPQAWIDRFDAQREEGRFPASLE